MPRASASGHVGGAATCEHAGWRSFNHACTKTLEGPDLDVGAAEFGRNSAGTGGRARFQQGPAPRRPSRGTGRAEEDRILCWRDDAASDWNSLGTDSEPALATAGRAATAAAR